MPANTAADSTCGMRRPPGVVAGLPTERCGRSPDRAHNDLTEGLLKGTDLPRNAQPQGRAGDLRSRGVARSGDRPQQRCTMPILA